MVIPEYIASGEVARLIPVAADSNKEARAASILMATLSSVPAFRTVLLDSLGQRAGTRANLDCFTEIVFKNDQNALKSRPDGLIILDSGRGRSWSCLVEAKIGNANLEHEQVERYLSLAKSNNINAVLTISNQFVALPTHYPIKILKSFLKGVELYHWSWMYTLTQALLILNEDKFENYEQKYILEEMTRYFNHPSIGVSSFDRMNPEWKELVNKIQSGVNFSKSDGLVENTIAAWHQEVRDLCLLMTRILNRPVRIKLTKAHTDDPLRRMKDDSDNLANNHKMECLLEIPDAAAPLVVIADLLRRSLCVSMTLSAPRDKQKSSSRINWILKQLSKSNTDNIHVRAFWPGRTPETQAQLVSLRDNPALLECDNKALTPTSFEVMLVRDLAGKFGGAKTFIEQLEEVAPLFYEQVGQHVRAYVVPPPRIKQKEESESIEDVVKSDVVTSSESIGEINGQSTDFLSENSGSK